MRNWGLFYKGFSEVCFVLVSFCYFCKIPCPHLFSCLFFLEFYFTHHIDSEVIAVFLTSLILCQFHFGQFLSTHFLYITIQSSQEGILHL